MNGVSEHTFSPEYTDRWAPKINPTVYPMARGERMAEAIAIIRKGTPHQNPREQEYLHGMSHQEFDSATDMWFKLCPEAAQQPEYYGQFPHELDDYIDFVGSDTMSPQVVY